MTFGRGAFRDRLLPISLSQGVGLLCGVAGVKVVSKLLPPSVLGTYGVFLTFTTLGLWLVHSGLVKYVGRHWAGATDRPAMIRAVLRAWMRKLPWLLAATAAGAASLHFFQQSPFTGTWPLLFAAAALLSLAALGQAALQAVRWHWRDFAAGATASVSRTFLPPLLFLAVGGGTLALYAGFLGHALLFAGACVLALELRRPARAAESAPGDPPPPSPASNGATAPITEVGAVYQGPLFFFLALAAWTLSGLNRWLTVWQFGEAEGGLFTLGGNMAAMVPTLLGAVFVQFFQPTFYQLGDRAAASPSGDPEPTRQLTRKVDHAVLMLVLACAAALLLLRAAAPALVGPLIDPRYAASVKWILPAGGFALGTMAAYFYHLMLLAAHREAACARVDLLTATLLATSALVCICIGDTAYRWALAGSPLLVLLVTRPLARAALSQQAGLRPGAPPAP
jgi:hypothetical protein